VSWADEAVHAVTPGATAAAVYLMVAKLEVMRALRVVPGRKGSRRFPPERRGFSYKE